MHAEKQTRSRLLRAFWGEVQIAVKKYIEDRIIIAVAKTARSWFINKDAYATVYVDKLEKESLPLKSLVRSALFLGEKSSLWSSKFLKEQNNWLISNLGLLEGREIAFDEFQTGIDRMVISNLKSDSFCFIFFIVPSKATASSNRARGIEYLPHGIKVNEGLWVVGYSLTWCKGARWRYV